MAYSPEEIIKLVCDDIQAGWYLQEMQAIQKAARIAKANEVLNRAHVEGLGEVHMSIPIEAYHSWGQKEGYEIWGDKSFQKAYKRDNPEVRVKSGSKKIQVGYGKLS